MWSSGGRVVDDAASKLNAVIILTGKPIMLPQKEALQPNSIEHKPAEVGRKLTEGTKLVMNNGIRQRIHGW